MNPTVIRPSVSSKTITKVTRLFNGTIGDILGELLQNSRRAGASRIDIACCADQDGARLRPLSMMDPALPIPRP